MLFVRIDFKRLAPACRFVGDNLTGKIHFDFHLRIGIDAVEQLLQKRLAHHYGKNKVVQLVILVDIGKEARHHHAEAIVGNGPSGMFATGARTEVLAGHKNLSAIGGIVQHKIRIGRAVGTVTPVAEKVLPETFAGCGLEKTGRNNLVGIDILQRERHTGACQYVEFLFHRCSGF